MATSDLDPKNCVRDMICPQCGEGFRLTWGSFEEGQVTLKIYRHSDKAIYAVSILCPHCEYEEEL